MATKVKEYTLIERSGATTTLQVGRNGKMTVYDPEFKRKDGGKGARRAIRHCPNQKSIFIDEQDENAVVEPIVFEAGLLEVPPSQPITQLFMDNHPSNKKNGGTWFEETNDEQTAKEANKDREILMEVMYAIKQMAKKEDGIHKLKAEVAVLNGNVESTDGLLTEELKEILYSAAEDNPSYFADEGGNVVIFEDDEVHRKYITLQAIRTGILKKSPNGRAMLWADTEKLICSSPASVNIVDHFVEYLTTDDGMLVLEEIGRRS